MAESEHSWAVADKETAQFIKLNEKRIARYNYAIAALILLFACSIASIFYFILLGNNLDLPSLQKEKTQCEEELENVRENQRIRNNTRDEWGNTPKNDIFKGAIEKLEQKLQTLDKKMASIARNNHIAFVVITSLWVLANILLVYLYNRDIKRLFAKEKIEITSAKCIGKEQVRYKVGSAYYCIVKYCNGKTEKTQVNKLCFDSVDYEADMIVVKPDSVVFRHTTRLYQYPPENQ